MATIPPSWRCSSRQDRRSPIRYGGARRCRTCCDGQACPTGSETMSKTRLFSGIKSLDVEAVSALLDSHPDLAKVKDERRRNALHFLCGLPASDKTEARSLALARLLLDRGFDVNEPAFVEGGGALRLSRSGTRSPAVATSPW